MADHNCPPGYAAWFDPKRQPKYEAEGISDKEFFALMESIKGAWFEYDRLQQMYIPLTGIKYTWLK